MSWWPYFWYRQPMGPYGVPGPTSPEDELKQLEEYRRQLEDEIKWVEEEMKRIDEEIERMKRELEKPESRQPAQTYAQPPYPPMPQPPMPVYGYGYGWGRRRGMRGGFGRGMGAGFTPAPAAMPQQTPVPPPQPGIKRVVASVEENKGLDSRISPRFGRCPFLAYIDIGDGEIKAVNIVPNQAASMPMGAGLAVAQTIIASGALEVIGSNFGPNVSMAFQQAGLKMNIVEPFIPLGEALKRLGLLR